MDSLVGLLEELLPVLYLSLQEAESQIVQANIVYTGNKQHEEVRACDEVNSLCRRVLEKADEEVTNFIPTEWEHLKQFSKGKINEHTLRLMVRMYMEPSFKQLNKHDQNLLLWSGLFHDLGKRGPPLLPGKDPFHPFKSAALTLRIMSRLGWVRSDYEFAENLAQDIEKAFFVEREIEYMDNSQVEDFLSRLLHLCNLSEKSTWNTIEEVCSGKSLQELFAFEVLLLVMFHQSISVLGEHPAFTPFSDSEIKKFYSFRVLKLSGFLMKFDSLSYTMALPNVTRDFGSEIDSVIALKLKLFEN